MFKIDLGRDKIMGIHVRCVIRQLTKGMEYTDSSHWNDIFQNVFQPRASEGIWVYYGYFRMMHDVFFGAKIHIFYKKQIHKDKEIFF